MNVLIADDDNVMIRLLSTSFRKAGFATYVAFDVVQATQLIRRHRIDAVVLDMQMPGGSGADVIDRLKLSRKTGDIQILVVSGSVEPDAREKLLARGADDFFPKPPDLERLVALIRSLTATAAARARNERQGKARKSGPNNARSTAEKLIAEAIEHHRA